MKELRRESNKKKLILTLLFLVMTGMIMTVSAYTMNWKTVPNTLKLDVANIAETGTISAPNVTETETATPNITETTIPPTESLPNVTETTIPPTESLPNVTETETISAPIVTETPNVTETETISAPIVAETPNVTETEAVPAPNVTGTETAPTPNVTEITILPTESLPNVSETETAIETIPAPNVTETETVPAPNVTDIPIPPEEKNLAINIVNNNIMNIGITNTQIIDVRRDTEHKENLRVRVKDQDSNEIIVVIVTPDGKAKPDIPEASITEVTNRFTGKHVSFQFTENSLTDFTVDGKLIFRKINLGFTSTKVKKVGRELRISDDKNMFIIHDDDQGIMTERSSDIEATYQVSSNIKLSGDGKKTDLSNNIEASIFNAHPDNPDQVIQTVSGDTVSVKINSGLSRFIVKQINDDFENRIFEGISRNQIGTIINIDSIDSHDITAFDVDTTINSIAQNTVSLSVNSDSHDGKIVALKINKDIFKALNLRTLVDGDEIQKAKDLDDLFKNDKLSFLPVVGQDIEILISFPSFSEHRIVVTSEPIVASISSTIPVTTDHGIKPPSATTVPVTTHGNKPPSVLLTFGIAAMLVIAYIISRRMR